MKKKLILIIMLLILSMPTALAIDNEYYKIDIPESYEKEKTDDDQELWTKTTKDYTSSILLYTVKNEDSLNISKYTSKDVNNQLEEFKANMLKEYEKEEVKANIKQLSGSIEKFNKYDAILMNIETEYTFDKNISEVYQKQYLISAKDYIYYVIISTSDKNVLTNDETNKILSSFEIKKELFKEDKSIKTKIITSIKENPIVYVCAGLLIVSTVFTAIKTRKKDEKENKKNK